MSASIQKRTPREGPVWRKAVIRRSGEVKSPHQPTHAPQQSAELFDRLAGPAIKSLDVTIAMQRFISEISPQRDDRHYCTQDLNDRCDMTSGCQVHRGSHSRLWLEQYPAGVPAVIDATHTRPSTASVAIYDERAKTEFATDHF
jgi:hypothetical protein